MMGRSHCIILFFLIVFFSTNAFAQKKIAEVYALSGTTTFRLKESDKWQKLKLGQKLNTDTTIKVAEGSRVGINYIDGRLIRLRENSEVKIQLDKRSETGQVSLIKGAIHLFNRSAESRFNISTPEVSAAIRGTELVIETTPTGTTNVSVIDGEALLENNSGRLRVEQGESATAKGKTAPTLTNLIKTNDQAEWALYFPTLISKDEYSLNNEQFLAALTLAENSDYLGALKQIAKLKDSTETKLLTATLNIKLGRISKAEEILNDLVKEPVALANLGTIYLIKNDRKKAYDIYNKLNDLNNNSPSVSLFRSIFAATNGDQKEALNNINLGLNSFPNEPILIARKAEILLGMGYSKQALATAKKAVNLAPKDPFIRTIYGFTQLTRKMSSEADESFRAAIELDQEQAEAYFGLALTKINNGSIDQGIDYLQKAIHLDSSRSIYRSYLGKAFFEIYEQELADQEYDLAIEKDPNDPTPYLYRAFSSLANNQLVSALSDIEKSIALNNNRAVYRSRSLLDQDLAVRSTSLAEVFSQMGFRETARIEALKSLSYDYTNYSAHRFLGESLEGDYYADAKFSQQTISEILSPLSFNAFQSFDGFFAETSLNDYAALFDGDQHRTKLLVGGTNVEDSIRAAAIQTGKEDNFGYLASYGTNYQGQKNVRDQRSKLALQYEINPENRLLLQGNVNSTDDETTEDKLEQLDFDTSISLVSKIAPDSTLLARYEYFNRDSDFSNSAVAESATQAIIFDSSMITMPEFDITLDQMTAEDIDTNRGQLQLLQGLDWGSLVAGAEYVSSSGDAKENSLIISDSSGIFSNLNRERNTFANYNADTTTYYGYLNARTTEWLNLTAGLSYKDLKMPAFDVLAPYANGSRSIDDLLPKAGFTLNLSDKLTARGAYFKTLGSSTVNDSGSIEPTIVGSFLQLLGDLPATQAENYGFGIDYKEPAEWYFGAEYIYRDLNRSNVEYDTHFIADFTQLNESFTLNETEGFEDEREDLIKSYLYHILSESTVGYLEYRRERLEAFDISEINDTHRIRSGLKYFSDAMWFLSLEADWYRQDRKGIFNFIDGSDNFWIANLGFGFRIPERKGAFQLQMINLFDSDFEYVSRDRFSDPSSGIGVLANLSVNF